MGNRKLAPEGLGGTAETSRRNGAGCPTGRPCHLVACLRMTSGVKTAEEVNFCTLIHSSKWSTRHGDDL